MEEEHCAIRDEIILSFGNLKAVSGAVMGHHSMPLIVLHRLRLPLLVDPCINDREFKLFING